VSFFTKETELSAAIYKYIQNAHRERVSLSSCLISYLAVCPGYLAIQGDGLLAVLAVWEVMLTKPAGLVR